MSWWWAGAIGAARVSSSSSFFCLIGTSHLHVIVFSDEMLVSYLYLDSGVEYWLLPSSFLSAPLLVNSSFHQSPYFVDFYFFNLRPRGSTCVPSAEDYFLYDFSLFRSSLHLWESFMISVDHGVSLRFEEHWLYFFFFLGADLGKLVYNMSRFSRFLWFIICQDSYKVEVVDYYRSELMKLIFWKLFCRWGLWFLFRFWYHG